MTSPPPRRLYSCGDRLGEASAGLGEVFFAIRNMYLSAQMAPEVFHLAYCASTAAIISLLENASLATLTFTGPCGETNVANSLHCAAGCGCLEVSNLLLKKCVQLNFAEDSQGRTPLAWAARHGMVKIVEMLLHEGADPTHPDSMGRLALHEAAENGFLQICQILLSSLSGSKPADVNRPCFSGYTSLHLAAANGSAGVCKLLLTSKADVVARTFGDGYSPLHVAALHDHAEVASLLLSHDSCLFLEEDNSGRTAFDIAADVGCQDAVSVLQEPQYEHQCLVQEWSDALRAASADRLLAEQYSLKVSRPCVECTSEELVEITCKVVDLEFRIVEYVLETLCCEGPLGAAPARLFYGRTGEQRKVDVVNFSVPRWRSTGSSVWQPGKAFKFRIIGRCERCPLAAVTILHGRLCLHGLMKF